MLLVSSTPAGPKLASLIVNKYGSSSARTVPVTLKYVFHDNHDGVCVNVRGKEAMCLIRLFGLDKNGVCRLTAVKQCDECYLTA